jgi:hypothetical protein
MGAKGPHLIRRQGDALLDCYKHLGPVHRGNVFYDPIANLLPGRQRLLIAHEIKVYTEGSLLRSKPRATPSNRFAFSKVPAIS